MLQKNRNAANRAKLEADTYYDRGTYDRYAKTYDYDGNMTARKRRIAAIVATYQMRKQKILDRYSVVRSYLRDNYGSPSYVTGELIVDNEETWL